MINHDYFQIETPCIGFIAKSGSGKTTLLEKIIRHFCDNGIRVAVVKHTHHNFELDIPGKDSYRLRHAGAQQTLITGPTRWALINENPDGHPDSGEQSRLHDAIQQLTPNSIDCVLIEGFKGIGYPKIELHRAELNQPNLFPTDPSIIAVATNANTLADCPLPILNINDTEQICQFLINTFTITGPQ